MLDGDILLPNMGLSEAELDAIQNTTNIIIHAACSVNLKHPLKRLHGPIIEATEMMAGIALTCTMLDRFVYVSTAYVNTYLYPHSGKPDLRINEEIYQLPSGCDAQDELNEVRGFGTSTAHEAEDFPWAYAYAKNLTERLLVSRFSDTPEKLLIVRPSIIGPAQCLPFPGYSMPMSSSPTIMAAEVLLYPFRRIRIATKMDNPDLEVTGDEVPVDVVADRLLCHLSMGSFGCIHAVSGARARGRYEPWRESLMKLRQIPWEVRPNWVKGDWNSPKQNSMCRMFALLGTSFDFVEDRTISLYQIMSEKDKAGLQLFTDIERRDQVSSRTEDIRYVMDRLALKSWLAWLVILLFYYNFGKASQTSQYAKL